MEKRLNRKIDSAFQDFKHQIKDKMSESDILGTSAGTGLLQFIYDFPAFAITKTDLQKRKRVKNCVPLMNDVVLLELVRNNAREEKKMEKNFAEHILKVFLMARLKSGNKSKILQKK